MAIQPPSIGGSPVNDRLLETAGAVFETMHIETSPQVREMVDGLATSADSRLREEGLADDPRAIRAAEVRLVYVLLAASLREEGTGFEFEALQAFPESTTMLSAGLLSEFLDGLCPIWPFCT